MRFFDVGSRTLFDIAVASVVGGLTVGVVVLASRQVADIKDLLATIGAVIGAAVAVWGALYVEGRKRDAERRMRYDDIRKALEFQIEGISRIAEGVWPIDTWISSLRRGRAILLRMRDQAQGLNFNSTLWIAWLDEHYDTQIAGIEKATASTWADDPNERTPVEIGLSALLGNLVKVREAMHLEPSSFECQAKKAINALRKKGQSQ